MAEKQEMAEQEPFELNELFAPPVQPVQANQNQPRIFNQEGSFYGYTRNNNPHQPINQAPQQSVPQNHQPQYMMQQ